MSKLSSALSAVKRWGQGVGQATFKNQNAGKMAEAANEALSSQHKKHLLHLGIAAGGASGLAGLTYLKGKSDGMKKHAGLFSRATVAEKATKAAKGKYKEIEKYLKSLPNDTKKHLLKKIKVKKGHLYAAGAGAAAAGAGAGYLAGKE
jgi:hypothetical protein